MAVTQALATWHARRGTTEGLRRATRWDPSNGHYHAQLARALQFSFEDVTLDEMVGHYERAAALDPRRAEAWADLGAAYEWAGRNKDAQRAFERARELFPNSPAINWKLSNFYFRGEDDTRGFAAGQLAIAGSSSLRRPAFDLAWRASADPARILSELLPADAAIYFDYIAYLSETHGMDAAAQAWSRMLELRLAFEPEEAFGYLGALIQHQRVDQLAEAWEALAARHPTVIRSRSSDPNLVLNGSFESEILNGGLDWRLLPIEGAEVNVDNVVSFDGVRSLRVRFDGRHNLDFQHVLEFVPVRPNTRYRFSAFVRTKAITSDSAPVLQVFDAYDAHQLFRATLGFNGTANWSPQGISFRTGPKTRLIVVRLARAPSRKFDNVIAGTVWLDRISLQAAK